MNKHNIGRRIIPIRIVIDQKNYPVPVIAIDNRERDKLRGVRSALPLAVCVAKINSLFV
jgi:hypothetical protein